MCLWDESFGNCLKTYQLHTSAIEEGGALYSDLPPIRSLVLGQGKILVGTKNSEVCTDVQCSVLCVCSVYVHLYTIACMKANAYILLYSIDSGGGKEWTDSPLDSG